MNIYSKKSMSVSNYFIVLLVTFFSTNLPASELNNDYFNGMQLAFVRMPVVPADDENIVEPKPKPKPAQQAPASKPAPVIKPTPAPVIKPVPASPATISPVNKPVTAPAIKPSTTPSTVKPAVKPVPVTKTSRPAASGRQQNIVWVIGVGIDMGGDTLGTLTYADGSSSTVKANDGFMLYAGVILPNETYTDFSTLLTVGYKNGGARGSGGGAMWTSIPLEAIELYRVNDLRLGLGISYHLNPQLSVSVPGTSYVDKYDNAIGFVAQIGWVPVREHYGIDLRYTSIKFQGNNVVGPSSASGNVAGLYASYRF